MAGEGQDAREMNALERELRALAPCAATIDVARLMYEAGQASLSPVPPVAPAKGSRTHWMWPVSTALTGSLAAWLGITLLFMHNRAELTGVPITAPAPDAPTVAITSPQVTAQAVTRPKTRKPQEFELSAPIIERSPDDGRYLRARQVAIERGVDALPAPTTSAPREASGGAARSTYGLLTPRLNSSWSGR